MNLINLTLHVGAGLYAPALLALFHGRFLRQEADSPSPSFPLKGSVKTPGDNVKIWEDRICLP